MCALFGVCWADIDNIFPILYARHMSKCPRVDVSREASTDREEVKVLCKESRKYANFQH